MALNIFGKEIGFIPANTSTVNSTAVGSILKVTDILSIEPASYEPGTFKLSKGHLKNKDHRPAMVVKVKEGTNAALVALANGETIRDMLYAPSLSAGVDGEHWRNCSIRVKPETSRSFEGDTVHKLVFYILSVTRGSVLPVVKYTYPS